MNKSLWIIFSITAGFTGFLLGYSVPPILEISGQSGAEVTIVNESPEEDGDLSDYYKSLQELK